MLFHSHPQPAAGDENAALALPHAPNSAGARTFAEDHRHAAVTGRHHLRWWITGERIVANGEVIIVEWWGLITEIVTKLNDRESVANEAGETTMVKLPQGWCESQWSYHKWGNEAGE